MRTKCKTLFMFQGYLVRILQTSEGWQASFGASVQAPFILMSDRPTYSEALVAVLTWIQFSAIEKLLSDFLLESESREILTRDEVDNLWGYRD